MVEDDFFADGFLSPAVADVEATARHQFAAEIAVFTDLNRHAMRKQYEIVIHGDDKREMVVSALYTRCLTNGQGAVALALRGMERQSAILLRAMLENLLALTACAKSDAFLAKYISADHVARKRHLANLIALGNLGEKQAWVEEQLAAVTALIRKEKFAEIKVKDMAEVAELSPLYLTVYALTSSAVHTGVRDLEHHLVKDTDARVTEMKNEPSLDSFPDQILVIAELTMLAVHGLSLVFHLDSHQFLQQKHEIIGVLTERQSSA